MFVEQELFVIQNGDSFLLYAPILRTIVAVSGGVVRDLQACEVSGVYPEGPIRNSLLKTGILLENVPPSPQPATIQPRLIKGTSRSAKRKQIGTDRLRMRLHLSEDPGQGADQFRGGLEVAVVSSRLARVLPETLRGIELR